jgi:DNA-binding protein HU-beta
LTAIHTRARITRFPGNSAAVSARATAPRPSDWRAPATGGQDGRGPQNGQIRIVLALREFFDELTTLAEKELKRSGEFVLPGMVKLVVQKRKARMGRNPATGEAIKIPAKTVVKARIAKQLKDTVLPKK